MANHGDKFVLHTLWHLRLRLKREYCRPGNHTMTEVLFQLLNKWRKIVFEEEKLTGGKSCWLRVRKEEKTEDTRRTFERYNTKTMNSRILRRGELKLIDALNMTSLQGSIA